MQGCKTCEHVKKVCEENGWKISPCKAHRDQAEEARRQTLWEELKAKEASKEDDFRADEEHDRRREETLLESYGTASWEDKWGTWYDSKYNQ